MTSYIITHSDPTGSTGVLVTTIEANRVALDVARNQLMFYNGDDLVAAFVSWYSYAPADTTVPAASAQSAPSPADTPSATDDSAGSDQPIGSDDASPAPQDGSEDTSK